jgi:DNA-binding transcriptional LysR family regulator
MVPRIAMQFPPRKRLLGILPVDLPQTAKPLALMTLKNRTLNPAVGLLINQLRDTTKRAAKAVRA